METAENDSIVRDMINIKKYLEKYETPSTSFLTASDTYELMIDPIRELKGMIGGLVDNLGKCLLKDDLLKCAGLEVFIVENEIRPKSSQSDIRTSESGASGTFYSSDSDVEAKSMEFEPKKTSEVANL